MTIDEYKETWKNNLLVSTSNEKNKGVVCN